MTSLRCGFEKDAKESEDANGGDDEDKKTTIGDAGLGSHGGIGPRITEGSLAQ